MKRSIRIRDLMLSATLPLLLVGSAVGCGGGDTSVNCSTLTSVPRYSQMSIWAVCTNCHSSSKSGDNRMGAPASINFDVYDTAKARASMAAEEVRGGDMPPKNSPFAGTLTDAQKQELYNWAACGTPQ